jgi:DNA modification methylase
MSGERCIDVATRGAVLHGVWQEKLADVEPEVMISDPPYTERIILGFRDGVDVENGRKGKFNFPYAAWSRDECAELVAWAVTHVRFWCVLFNDHIGVRWLEEEFSTRGWYTFAPLPWVRTDPPPRFGGDGPCSATEYIFVARPKRRLPSERKGSRPGWYSGPGESSGRKGSKAIVTGQKPLWLMRTLVRAYSLQDDLIVDPFAGSGTTLVAAIEQGRLALGCEIDDARFKAAQQRLATADQQQLLPMRSRPKQLNLQEIK